MVTTRKGSRRASSVRATDVRALGRLTIDGIVALTDLAESLHLNVRSVSMPLGRSAVGRTKGITGLAYQSVRGITRVVGMGLDLALAPLVALSDAASQTNDVATPTRDAVIAALNGVLGDHLAATGNPLATTMQWRFRGAALPTRFPPDVTGKVLVLVHGLCMNDVQWQRGGHDHGQALEHDLGFTSIYLRYNTGLPISQNGEELAHQMETLIEHWPVEVKEFVILTHSMGGMVARSALKHATAQSLSWVGQLNKLVFLGTPHLGAPLERGGHWIDQLLDVSPYSAPFVRLGKMRSAGITDLRTGDIDRRNTNTRKARLSAVDSTAMPPTIRCFAIAGSTGKRAGDISDVVLGDGLVPVNSALGHHADPTRALRIAKSRQAIVFETNHMALLSSSRVYTLLKKWLAT